MGLATFETQGSDELWVLKNTSPGVSGGARMRSPGRTGAGPESEAINAIVPDSASCHCNLIALFVCRFFTFIFFRFLFHSS